MTSIEEEVVHYGIQTHTKCKNKRTAYATTGSRAASETTSFRRNPGIPSTGVPEAGAAALAASLALRPVAGLTWLAATVTAAMVWSRVCLGVHFPSDVLASAIGIGVAATRIGAIGGSMAGGQLLEAGFTPAQFFAAIAIPVACCLLLAQWRSVKG